MGSPLSPRAVQVEAVIDRLAAVYPEPDITLDFSTRMELLVAVILSAQCTDERVNQVTAELFDLYRTVDDFAEADPEQLAEDIGSITYPNQKAGYIVEAARQIRDEHEGEVPDTMAALTDLPGVGRKTANVVLQHGHDLVEGIVVDTHVQRLSQRLALTEESTPAAIEQDLRPVVPREHWRAFTHWLISHGRDTCTARSPDCEGCVLEEICPSSRLDGEVDLASGETLH